MQSQQATQAAIDSLPDPVVVLDRDGAVLNLNRSAEALFLLDAGQGVDAPLPRLPGLPGERLESVRKHVLAGRGPYVPRGFDEAVTVEGVGGPRRLLPRATALRSAEGEISGVALVLQDVTRLVRIDELRNDVVSTVAHEFRTPLTSLQMAVHLCGDRAAGPLTEEQAELMAGARRDCDRLLALVDDILDLSRIQAGKIEIEARPANAKARGGLGLGLYISREIVQAHGGAMGVESEEGRGSALWFTLPLA